MGGRGVRPGRLAGAGLSAALWTLASLGPPPVIAQTYDEAQLARIREIMVGQGLDPVDDYGKDPDPELPECLPFASSAVGPDRAAGHGIRSGIGTLPAPGLIDTDVTVIVWSRDGISCGQAIAKQMYVWVSGDRRLVPQSPPEIFAIGGMPAAVGIDSMGSKIVSTIGGVAGYRRGSARGTFDCGNVEVDVLQYRLASSPTATLADRDTLATAAKADVKQTLTSLGQALVNANLCSGSWQSGTASTPTPFTALLACAYHEAPTAPGMARCVAGSTGVPADASPSDISYRWTWDGTQDSRTSGETFSRPDAEIGPGTHTVGVIAVDGRTGATSAPVSWTFTADSSGGVPGGSGATAPAASASLVAGPFAVSVGCSYDRVDERITCLATPEDAPAGATLTYSWKVDGQAQAETGRFLDIPVRRDETNGTHLVAVQAIDPATGARTPEASTTIAYGEPPAGPSIEVVLFGTGVGLLVLVALTGLAIRSGRPGGGKGGKQPSEPDIGESVMEALGAAVTPDETLGSTAPSDTSEAGQGRPPASGG